MGAMNYATKLMFFPQQIFAAAIATVIFPMLSHHFAREDRARLARGVTTGLRLVNFILIPSMIGLIVLAEPIVQTLFQRGSLNGNFARLRTTFLPFAAVGLVSIGAGLLLTKSCFACRAVAWTVAIAVFTVAFNVALSLLWIHPLGARGLLLANSVSQTAQALLLLALLWRVVRTLDIGSLISSLLRILASYVIMGAALYAVSSRLHPGASLISRLSDLIVELALGAAVFVGAAALLQVKELSLATRIVRDRLNRNGAVPDENAMSAGSLP